MRRNGLFRSVSNIQALTVAPSGCAFDVPVWGVRQREPASAAWEASCIDSLSARSHSDRMNYLAERRAEERDRRRGEILDAAEARAFTRVVWLENLVSAVASRRTAPLAVAMSTYR